MTAAIQSFSEMAKSAGRWEIYWAAGVGTMHSSETSLEAETKIVAKLLDCIESSTILRAIPGAISYASSAGAIYAGSNTFVIDEGSIPAPTTPYARAKLQQEAMMEAFGKAHDKVSVLVARISTLYGPGQSRGKRQGLITHIARNITMNLPVYIYVPFDTIRDYIMSDDAADEIVGALREIEEPGGFRLRIVASGQPVTIIEIVETFRRLSRRKLRVIPLAGTLGGAYPRCMLYRSKFTLGDRAMHRTTLLVGISQVMAAERAAFLRGSALTG